MSAVERALAHLEQARQLLGARDLTVVAGPVDLPTLADGLIAGAELSNLSREHMGELRRGRVRLELVCPRSVDRASTEERVR